MVKQIPRKRRPGRGFDEISIGEKSTAHFDISEESVARLSNVDKNPLHSDKEYAQKTIFKGCIVHGALVFEYVSKMCGERLPGHGWAFTDCVAHFMRPVRMNDVVQIDVTVEKKDPSKRNITCSFVCTIFENGRRVMSGTVTLIDADAKNR